MKMVGKGIAGSGKGMEYQQWTLRRGGESRICSSVWIEGNTEDRRGRWGQVTEGLACWAQQLGFLP